MWVEPNGHVQILQNVPLDIAHDNTIYFATREAQHQYFANKTKRTTGGQLLYFDHVTYQRVRRNHIRLEVNAEELYDCNYLMFQNTAFGSSRWFYAFIVGTEYVANQVTEITYEIDDIQTWFIVDCTIGHTYVEREHILVDSVGANRVEENVESGEYKIVNPLYSFDTNSPRNVLARQAIVIVSTEMWLAGAQGGSWVSADFSFANNIGSGCHYSVLEFDMNNQTEKYAAIDRMNTFLEAITTENKSEAIVAVFQCPAYLFHNYELDDEGYWVSSPVTFNYEHVKPTTLDGYTPHNKKLLQYPYNFLIVDDCHGTNQSFAYENWPDNPNNFRFKYILCGSADPSMDLVPIDYNGISGENYFYRMTYKSFPQCSFSIDQYKAYVAQNGGAIPTIASDVVSPIIGGVNTMLGYDIGMMKDMGILENNASYDRVRPAGGEALYGAAIMGHTALGNINAASRVISDLGAFKGKQNMPSAVKGNYNGDALYSIGINDFVFAQKCLYRQNAERIDRFFDMFGYATKTIKTPNINTRDHWNYVKLLNPNIFGNIPADSLGNIKRIFENGITFWKNGNEVGNYTLDNWSSAWA